MQAPSEYQQCHLWHEIIFLYDNLCRQNKKNRQVFGSFFKGEKIIFCFSCELDENKEKLKNIFIKI